MLLTLPIKPTRDEQRFLDLKEQFPSNVLWDWNRLQDSLTERITMCARRGEVEGRSTFTIPWLARTDHVMVVFEGMKSAYGDLLVKEQAIAKRGRWTSWHARTSRVAKPLWTRRAA